MVASVQDRMDQAGTARSGVHSPTGWGAMLALGLVVIAAGIAALLLPGLTAVTASIFAGWILLLIGIAGVVMGINTRRAHGRWSDVALGGLSIVAAIVIFANPLLSTISLTMAVTVWFAVRGVIELASAMRAPAGGARGMLVLAGIIDLALAVLLFLNFPYPAVQAIGLFIGISLIISGVFTVIAALGLKRLQTR